MTDSAAAAAAAADGSTPTKKDDKKLVRMMKLVNLVQSGRPHTPATLAGELGVGERSVHRYIKDLEKSGIPLVFDAEWGGYRPRHGTFMAPVALTADEALALAAVCTMVAEQDAIAFTQPAVSALNKIAATLPEDLRDEMRDVSDAMMLRTPGTNPGDGHGDVYDTVRRAIAQRRALVCRYDALHGRGTDEEFDFEPYALLFSVRAWYAVGYRSDREALRTLKLSRFSKCTPTGRAYEIPADFSLETHLGNAWGMIRGETEYDVELRIDAAFAETFSDTEWHRTQELEWLDDGGVVFRCRVAGLDEIVWWVLGLGSQCTVVQPPELRERVREEARAILDRGVG
jgi:predicted DNA-binding transcriptional regulator YafY